MEIAPYKLGEFKSHSLTFTEIILVKSWHHDTYFFVLCNVVELLVVLLIFFLTENLSVLSDMLQ